MLPVSGSEVIVGFPVCAASSLPVRTTTVNLSALSTGGFGEVGDVGDVGEVGEAREVGEVEEVG